MADIESGSTSSLHHASPSRVENSTPEQLQEAKKTFKDVFDEYKQQVVDNNNLETKSKKVEDMTVEEKQQLSDYRNIQTILTATNDGEKEFEVPGLKFEGDKTSFENVPVEGLTGYLGKRIDELNDRVKTLTDPPRVLTEDETKELNAAHQELGKKHQQYAILDQFSVKLLDLPNGKEVPRPGTFAYERLAWEAYMISQDPLRASTNSDPAMQMEENWLAASRALDRRRVLVDPPAATAALTPAPVAAAPAAAAATALPPAPIAPPVSVSSAAPPTVASPGTSASVSSPASVDTSTAGKTYTGRFMSRTEEMDKRARIQAINQVNKELKVDKWWQRLNPIDIFRKVRVRWGEDYYTTKYTEIIKAEMIKNNTSLLEYDFATKSVKAINDQDRESERLTGEEKLTFIQGLEAEEKSRRLGQKLVDLDNGDPADKALKTAMFKDLLRPLAMRLGDTGDLAFASREKKEEEMQKLFRKFLGDKLNSTNASDADVKAKLKDFFGADLARNTADSMYFSGSLLDMTEEIVKDKTAAAFANDSLADIINLKFAETTWLHGTEFKYKNTDKLVHWAKSHRLPLTPMVMAATFSIVTGVVVAGSKSSLTKLTVPVVGTIFGAITSAVRAKAEQNKDMTKYRIERALGKTMNPNLKKHKEYERMSYNIKKYDDLLNGAPRNSNVPQTPDLIYEQKSIDQLRQDVEADVKANYANVTAQTLALRRIGEMQARLELSMKVVDASGKRTEDRSDFLSFNEKTVDQNRAHMLLEYTKLRLETSRIIKAEIVSQMKSVNPNVSQADIDLALANKENEMKTSEDTWRQRYITDLLQNKADKDKEFNVHKVVKSAKAAGFGSVVGLFTGLGIHEGVVWAGRGISGGLEAIEHVIKDAGIGNAAGIDKNIQFLHGINEGLQGQSVVDRWNSIKSTDQFQDVLAKLAGVVPVEHNGRVDSFIGLYNHPGTVDLGSHYSITSNANHELSFFDKTTNTNVPFPFPATVDQSGVMHIIGDKANLGTDLPVDLRTELTQGNFDIQPGPYHRETIFGGPKDPIFDPADPTTTSALGSIPATEHAQLFGEDVMIPKDTEFRQDPSGFTDLVIKSPDPKIDGTVIMNDVQVKPDGTLGYDSGIDRSAIQVSEVNYVDTTKTITPEQMWNENSTHVDKIEGYNYNLHQVQYDNDLNRNISVGHRVELDARDYKTADGKYVMEPYPTKDVSIQKGLVPEKMDLQKYFDPKYGGEQGAYALLHPAGDGHNEIIAFKPVDGDKLVFDIHNTDPTKKIFVYDNATHDYTKEVSYTDFSKMFVNENELNKFNGASQVEHNYKLLNLLAPNTPTAPAGAPQPFGMLSIGQMVVEDKNGVPVIKGASGGWQYDDGRAVTNPSELQTVWKSTRGGIFNGRPEGVPTGSKLIEINGHRIDELYKTWDIKAPKEIIDQPLIVAPWDIRSPLEPLLFIYGYGGTYSRSALGLLDWGEFEARKSTALRNNPKAILDEKTEVREYLNKQNTQFLNELRNMNAVINRPMEENCRIVITIPARQEGKIIKGALEKFLNQKDRSGNLIDPALFEIVLVDNHPENEPADDTKQQVDEFMRNHPEIRLSYAHKAWKSGEGNVGRARKYATDLALFRDSNRSRQNGDLILVNNDADIDGLSDEYVFEMINQFDTYKDVDAVAAKWTLPPEALAKPNLRAAERLWYILDRVIQKDLAGIPGGRNIRAPGLIGRNSAFRTSIYAAVGGFNPNATLAEDLEMGWMINQGRGNDPTRFKFVNRAEVVSNPRRFLAAWFQNTPLIQMYGGFHENTAVRSMDNQQLLASVPDTLDSARFETEADALWRAAKDPQGQYSWLGPRFDDLFKRTMEFMDVDYQIEDRLDADGVTRSHVKITETARLVAGMARNKANRVP